MRLILFAMLIALVLANFSISSADEPSFDEINIFGSETIDNASVLSENTEESQPVVIRENNAVSIPIALFGTPATEAEPVIKIKPVVEKTVTNKEKIKKTEDRKTPDYVGFPLEKHTQFNQYEVCTDNRNACGTTSLSMIMADQGLLEKDLKAAQALDHDVRPWGGFSAPYDLRRHARSNGLYTASLNKASFEDLEERLSRGNSVQCMVSGGSTPHWIYIMGIETDPETGKKTVIIADPGDHKPSRMSQEDFEKKWKEPNTGMAGSFMNDAAGYENYMLVYDKDWKNIPFLSKDYGISSTENLTDGLTDLANFPSQIGEGKVGTGLGHLIGGSIRVVASIPGTIGAIVETGGDRVLDWSGEKWDEGGVGNKVLAGGGYVVGGVVKVAGVVTHVAGNAVSAVGEFTGSTIETIGETADKVVGKVWGWITGD